MEKGISCRCSWLSGFPKLGCVGNLQQIFTRDTWIETRGSFMLDMGRLGASGKGAKEMGGYPKSLDHR